VANVDITVGVGQGRGDQNSTHSSSQESTNIEEYCRIQRPMHKVLATRSPLGRVIVSLCPPLRECGRGTVRQAGLVRIAEVEDIAAPRAGVPANQSDAE
jgi:hypothetical protein